MASPSVEISELFAVHLSKLYNAMYSIAVSYAYTFHWYYDAKDFLLFFQRTAIDKQIAVIEKLRFFKCRLVIGGPHCQSHDIYSYIPLCREFAIF